MELIVYHDEEYPTVWVPREASRKIASFLKSKNFVVNNADDLRDWMKKSIKENKCWQTVLVFSQDVVPDTICHTPSPSALVREYLDCGGRIIWIGDVPFFYYGFRHSRKAQFDIPDVALYPLIPQKEDTFEGIDFAKATSGIFKDKNGKLAKRWGSGACFSILGVMPLYLDFPSLKVSITKQGKWLGINNPWYSIRPIIVKGSNLGKGKVTILATAKPLSLISIRKKIFRARVRTLQEVEIEERRISFPSIIDTLSKFLGPITTIGLALSSIAAGLGGFGAIPSIVWFVVAAALFLLTLMLWFFHWRQRIASAWFKNFNNKYPTSGFVRIWDFKLHDITNDMLNELYNIALLRASSE
jgi:hypothetical protein